jgi:hypothetical protein
MSTGTPVLKDNSNQGYNRKQLKSSRAITHVSHKPVVWLRSEPDASAETDGVLLPLWNRKLKGKELIRGSAFTETTESRLSIGLIFYRQLVALDRDSIQLFRNLTAKL